MDIFYLLYLSAATRWFNGEELEALLAVSQRNNRREQLTGVLLYGQNNFIQLLEGPETHVQRIFEHIKKDQRHSDVTVIASGYIRERCFPDWFMGFKAVRPESFAHMNNLVELTQKAIQRNDCELPVRFLDFFVKKNPLS